MPVKNALMTPGIAFSRPPMTDIAKLELSGGFRLTTADGRDVPVSSRKARGLLAILALSPGQSATRARLRGLLWSDRGEQQAGDSLRQLLATLRKELAEAGLDIIQSRDDTLTLAACEVPATDDGNAIESHHGDLLAGLDVGDEAFEEWLAHERRSYAARMTENFERIAARETGAARLAAARRLLAIDPLREASHRSLISALLEAGETALALKQLEDCRAILKRELGVAPSAETEALLQDPAQSPASSMPQRPIIAILPFTNLGDDPAQAYFSEGISTDIATELSRFRQFTVRSVKPGNDGAAGADYAADGSVRRLGNRIRISVRLTDQQGGQLWSERFDAGEENIFEMQDRIVASVAAQLSQRLNVDIVAKSTRKPPASIAAYEYLLRGDALPNGDPKVEDEARALFRKAIELDPGYARAYSYLGEYTMLIWMRDLDAPRALLDEALALTSKAIALDDRDASCHAAHGHVQMWLGNLELSEHHYMKSLALNPNHPGHLAGLGILYGYLGEAERGIALYEQVLELDPHFNPTWYWRDKGTILFMAKRYEEAITCLERSPMRMDVFEAYLAACHSYLGEAVHARQHVDTALLLTPSLTISKIRAAEPFRRSEDADHLAEGLRLAGLPE